MTVPDFIASALRHLGSRAPRKWPANFVIGTLVALLWLPVSPSAAQDATYASFNWALAKQRAENSPRPRSFPAGAETTAIFEAARVGSRKPGFDALTRKLDRAPIDLISARTIEASRKALSTTQRALVGVNIKNAVLADTNYAQNAGFAALATGSPRYRSDAMHAIVTLAALDPTGETGATNEMLSAMLVTRTLALGLDWFYSSWTAAQRQLLVQAITARMNDFTARLMRGPRPLERFPLVSQENQILAALAETAVLLVGETPAADQWFNEIVPLYARLLTPFGGDDGGYANGTTYASWDLGEYSLRQWDTLRRAIGLDMTQKPWARNVGRYLAYFLPPGTPAGLFGDGAELEMRETWARYGKAYAYRVPTPLSRWYASQWFQEDTSRLELLSAPVLPAGETTNFPTGTPDAAFFPSIGWVAMHSSLADRGRTSVYFKSSPFGAVSHSHSNQNSFVVNAGGRQLLINSGYYDYFGSPHHFGWTKRTVAQNAVTFDGGIGQDDPARPWGEESAKGKVTAFSTTERLDLTVGDATAAYRGLLKRATRALAFLRPNVVIVFDHLESEGARTWEWNVHALNKLAMADDQTLIATNLDAKACIRFRASTPTLFQQTSDFAAPPQRDNATSRPDQWHGQHRSTGRTTRFDSVAVISVGCTPVQAEVDFQNDATTIRVGNTTLAFDGARLTATTP